MFWRKSKMKIKITMNDPDAMHYAVREAVEKSVLEGKSKDLSDIEKQAVIEVRHDNVLNKVSKWFQNQKYMVVEIDTERDTCTVIPQK